MTVLLSPDQAVQQLWRLAGLATERAATLRLSGADPVLASSFAVGTAAQATLGAAALAAAEFGHARNGVAQEVALDMRHAALECLAHFSIDGRVPERWDKISGLYACRDGWVRIHANFAHHRDGALKLLELPPGADTGKADVARALQRWDAVEFESAAASAGLVVAAARSFEQWDAHPQAAAIAALPLLSIERIDAAAPLVLAPLAAAARPLDGIHVLDLTRILAGPVGGRTLAAYGADVMLVNSPGLPNIESIIETSRGKLSCHVDLQTAAGRDTLRALLGEAHVFSQGYRPGGLASLGFAPQDLARMRPGIVAVSLCAYGHTGPWSGRRGFDSLVQTATGINHAEGQAAGSGDPRPLPIQVLDYASGFLMAIGASAALLRQAREGGSWHVRVSLAQTAHWLRSLGRVDGGFGIDPPDLAPYLDTSASGWGELVAIRHAAQFSRTPAGWTRPSVRPGTHPPRWPHT